MDNASAIRQRALSVPWTCCAIPIPQKIIDAFDDAYKRATSRIVRAGIPQSSSIASGSDLVADSGGTYLLGFSYFVVNWVGVVGGWALAAFVIFPVIYRAGMYTNAEYLEARFGPSVRVLCALIQVQYRTLVLAIIATTLYLTLSIVCGWGAAAWWAVVAIAVLASVYTALGGLRSVAVTDSPK